MTRKHNSKTRDLSMLRNCKTSSSKVIENSESMSANITLSQIISMSTRARMPAITKAMKSRTARIASTSKRSLFLPVGSSVVMERG